MSLDKVKKAVSDSGMTVTSIAKRSGIKVHTLHRRLAGEGEFTATEITGMAKALKLSQKEVFDIFLS